MAQSVAPARHALPWNERDDKKLTLLWGSTDLLPLAAVLERTPVSVTARAMRLGLGAPSRETRPLIALVRSSGYTWTKVLAAAERLGIKLERARRMCVRQKRRISTYALTEEQEDAILEFLKAQPDGRRLARMTGQRTVRGVWGIGTKPACCQDCGTKERPHRCAGRCSRCYASFARQRRITREEPSNSGDSVGAQR